MDIKFADPSLPTSGVAAVAVHEDRKLAPTAAQIDEAAGGALTRAMAASRFSGRKDERLDVLGLRNVSLDRVVLVGLGKPKDLSQQRLEDAGGALLAHLNAAGVKRCVAALDDLGGAEGAAHVGFGALLRSYRFDKYRTKQKPEDKPTMTELVVQAADPKATRAAFKTFDKVAEGVFLTRDLVSEPANIIYPETLAAQGAKLARAGVEVEVLDVNDMKKLGMGALLGVGQGSAHEPRLLVMQWKGAGKSDQPVAFVGKGVTFDSGGISIKPAGGMEDMKWDMGGAGVVIGLMKALALRKAKVNAVGVCGLVENMPSAMAQRPGDIVTSMSAQTIEVINTDAEGRLVLADALWYTQDRFKPQFMVDLATLTGAIIIALGNDHAGLFSNNEALAERLVEAGKAVGEHLWRLPLGDAYDKLINTDAADMKNVGGREAGSITAAQFLQRFVNDVPWAHMDIAGTTWSKKDKSTVPKGGTGFGVRLLDRLVADHYEK